MLSIKKPFKSIFTFIIVISIAQFSHAQVANQIADQITENIAEQLRQGRTFTQAGLDAFKAGDLAGYLSNMTEANARRPAHPTLLYHLARAQMLNGQHQRAAENLTKVAMMGIAFDLDRDTAFEALEETKRAQLKRYVENNRQVIGTENLVFSLSDADFIPEGIAFDYKIGNYYVGSVHKRKIVSFDYAAGEVVFADSSSGLMSVLGIAIDTERRLLWACTAGLPQTNNLDSTLLGQTGLIAFNLDSGEKVKQVMLSIESTNMNQKHSLGDLVIAEDGTVYVSDGYAGGIYRLMPESNELEVFLAPGTLSSPQGMQFSADESTLFIADYAIGILSVNLESKQITSLPIPKNTSLLGIDGMVRHQNSLIIIQNGIRPHRIVKLTFNDAQTEFVDSKILAMNLEGFDEPTLGILVGESLFYIANSQWGHFDRSGILKPENLVAPNIFKLPVID